VDVVQIKVVVVVATNHVVWEDVALFVIVVALKVDVEKILVLEMDALLVLILKKFYWMLDF
jgi:hypothetical protein